MQSIGRRRSIAARWIALAVAPVLGAKVSAQAIVRQSFTATVKSSSDSDFVEPPDTMGAVGIDQYAQFLNGTFSVYNKSNGGEVMNITDASFWANANVDLSNADGTSDPRIIFDPNTKRWFACQVDFQQDLDTGEVLPDNHILLAVSNTSNPAGTWTGLPKINADPAHSSFGDFPRMGLDANGVYLITDNFQNATDSAPSTINIVSIPKADLVATTPTLSRMTQFGMESPSDRGFAAQPVLDLSSTSAHGTILAIDNDIFGQLNRTTINNPGGAGATLSPSVNIAVAPTAFPPGAQQPDTPDTIETNDDRISAQVLKVGNSLWAVQETGYPANSRSPRSALRWYQLNETNNTLMQPEGTIYDPNHDMYMPSIAANQFGDVVIGFTRSSTSEYASAYAIVGSTSGGVTTFGSPILLQEGLQAYDVALLGSPNRWGDYSSTTVDPADPYIFWTIQEYAEVDNSFFGVGAWGTHVDELIIPHANEARWAGPTSGTFSTSSLWLTNAAAGVNDHAIFSVATAPSLTGYTVSFTGNVTNARASVRQGLVTFGLSAHTYTLTGSDPANPSLAVGEFGGEPQLTLTGGTVQSVNALVGAGTSNALLTVTSAGTTWNNTGSVFVGGTNTAASGTGTLRIQNSAAVNIGGTLKVWSAGRVEFNGGTLVIGATNLNGGGKLVAASGGGKVVRTGSVTIDTANHSQLDLSDNKLIATADSLGSFVSGAYTGITGLIASGRNGGSPNANFNGGGIVTSQSNAISPNFLTTLGVATAGSVSKSTFGGVSVASTDVLVMYTYAGDADLSGSITGDDYFRIDQGFSSHGSLLGWVNGDFDYNGHINADDYFIIDRNYAHQGPPISTISAPSLDGIAAVPEPATLLLPIFTMSLFAFSRSACGARRAT